MNLHPYHQWPQQHRNLLVAAILLLLLTFLAYLLFFRTRCQELADSRRALAKTMKKLQATSWPNDATRLKLLLSGFNKELEGGGQTPGLKKLSENTLQHCTSLFQARIAYEYADDRNFLEKASLIEYKDQFDKLDSLLQSQQVFLSPKIFGLDESSVEENKYQMLLKLWTTEKLVQLAREHHLTIATVPDQGEGKNRKGSSLLTSLPIVSYVLEEGEQLPYLLEIPVRMTLCGSMSDFLSFAENLQKDDCFLPMTRMELVTPYYPNTQAVFKDGKLTRPGFLNEQGQHVIDQIQATVTCSAFYRPSSGKLPKASLHTQKPALPAGA